MENNRSKIEKVMTVIRELLEVVLLTIAFYRPAKRSEVSADRLTLRR